MSNLKTNPMRILEKEKIKYKSYSYDYENGPVDGITVAKEIGKSVDKVYKTLIAQGRSGEYYVYIIPVAYELNLKAGARAVGEKAIKMIKVSDIVKVTGYVRGGCSPIGIKKSYKTILDKSSGNLETIIISGGKIGCQIELNPKDLINLLQCSVSEII